MPNYAIQYDGTMGLGSFEVTWTSGSVSELTVIENCKQSNPSTQIIRRGKTGLPQKIAMVPQLVTLAGTMQISSSYPNVGSTFSASVQVGTQPSNTVWMIDTLDANFDQDSDWKADFTAHAKLN